MKGVGLPQFPYGAVYFRKSNPPAEEWARDYRQAAEDGMNAFRHWFLWSAIEVAPGRFDWREYDAQLDLAARHGIKTVIAEISHAAPEWAFRKLSHARYCDADGRPVNSRMRNSSATGGFPGLCLDNDDALQLAQNFLETLVNRYKEHPGLGYYDIWNELNLVSSAYPACYCPGTLGKFREWLQSKYGDVGTLGQAWRRHSFTEWEDVLPPEVLGPYPDSIDSSQFRFDNAYRLLRWRVETVRRLDPNHPVTGHGVEGAALHRRLKAADDPWRAAALLDGYGYTGGGANGRADEWPGRRWSFGDLARAGADGKPFWAAELSGGPLWTERGGARREDGRIPEARHVRRAQFIAMACGAKGIFSLRWRPLTDGPNFGSLGFYGMDGLPTERSEMAAAIAKWANAGAQKALWEAAPVTGDVGILVVPETQIFASLHMGDSTYFHNALRGTYRAFWDSHMQADWVALDQIDGYDLLYLPCPYMLNRETAERLIQWVAAGGSLISEGCPGYFDGGGRAGARQPNMGLDQLFGATEGYVEFTPDLLEIERPPFSIGDEKGEAAWYLQSYEPVGGVAVGAYPDGRVAVVDHVYGRGKTRLIGTSPGLAYWNAPSERGRRLYSSFVSWAGKHQHVVCSDTAVRARLHRRGEETFLWVVNPSEESRHVTLTLSDSWGPFDDLELHWGAERPRVDGRILRCRIPACDGLVMRLLPMKGRQR